MKPSAANRIAAASNMLANKLFPLLAKPEVQELVLLSGKPPCAVVNGTYRRLSAQTLRDEDVMAVVMAARGQEHAARLADGVQWAFVLPGVGKIEVAARYDGPVLRMSLRLARGQSQSTQDTRQAHPRASADTVSSQLAHEAQREAPPSARQPDVVAAPVARVAHEAPPSARQLDDGVAHARGDFRGIDAPPSARQLDGAAAARGDSRGIDAPPSAAVDGLELAAAPPTAARSSRSSQEIPAQSVPQLELDDPWMAWKRRAGDAPEAVEAVSGDALDLLLNRAREQRASDLHVLADRPATLRIAGDLVAQPERFDAATLEEALIARVPERAREILERDGSCDFALVHPACGRFRANVGRQRTGMKLTARPIHSEIPTLAALGLPDSIAGVLEHHQGLIVITGPTGHGKTTTLAALVGILNRETSHHVITVEDPIEYVHETASAVISQREVGTHTKTFGAALKGALREDPDVIVVGELRDTETVRMALSASETGHLVISTMNTPSAAKAIERLIDLFPPGDQPQVRMTLAGGLRLIISQRLVPSADRSALCAAAEVLPGSTPLWNLIRDNRTFQISSLQQRGKSLGIVRLDDSLAELVRAGKTTLEIAREYADSTDLLETLVQGRGVPARAESVPENQNDAADSLQKRGVELGKQVLSRAGKLFGGENK